MDKQDKHWEKMKVNVFKKNRKAGVKSKKKEKNVKKRQKKKRQKNKINKGKKNKYI